jgi:hypothetical protein
MDAGESGGAKPERQWQKKPRPQRLSPSWAARTAGIRNMNMA